MTLVVRFTDGIGGATLLDLSPGAGNAIEAADGLLAPPPPLVRTVVASTLRDGSIVSASAYGLRTVTMPLAVNSAVCPRTAAGDGARRTAVGALMRVLQAPRGWLEVRDAASDTSRWLHLYQCADAELLATLWQTWAKVTVTAVADPFGFGPELILGTYTMAAGTDFTATVPAAAAVGDVPAPMMVTYDADAGAQDLVVVASRTGPTAHTALVDLTTWGTDDGTFRSFTDGATQVSRSTVSSASAAFTSADVGLLMFGAVLPAAGTPIVSVTATVATLQDDATATVTRGPFTVGTTTGTAPVLRGNNTYSPTGHELYWRSAAAAAPASTVDAYGPLVALRAGADRALLAGTYRLFLLADTDGAINGSPVTVTLSSAVTPSGGAPVPVYGTATVTTTGFIASGNLYDLGLVELPAGAAGVRAGLRPALPAQDVWALLHAVAANDGTESSLQALLVVPADESLLMLQVSLPAATAAPAGVPVPPPSTSARFTLDPFTGAVLAENLDPALAGTSWAQQPPAAYVGAPPRITPGRTLTLVGFRGYQQALTARVSPPFCDLTVLLSYWPQYLSVL